MATNYNAKIQAEVNRLMKTGMSKEDALELAKYDYDVDHDCATEHDFTPEQKKASKKARSTGTRKVTTYNFKQRERKPNETKRAIIQYLHSLFAEKEEYTNLTISNPERQIDFVADGKNYSITLTEHRPKKE